MTLMTTQLTSLILQLLSILFFISAKLKVHIPDSYHYLLKKETETQEKMAELRQEKKKAQDVISSANLIKSRAEMEARKILESAKRKNKEAEDIHDRAQQLYSKAYSRLAEVDEQEQEEISEIKKIEKLYEENRDEAIKKLHATKITTAAADEMRRDLLARDNLYTEITKLFGIADAIRVDDICNLTGIRRTDVLLSLTKLGIPDLKISGDLLYKEGEITPESLDRLFVEWAKSTKKI